MPPRESTRPLHLVSIRAEGESEPSRSPERREESSELTSLPYKVAKRRFVDGFERRYLRELCVRFAGNLSAAARAAGLSRRHLRSLYQKHGLRDPGGDA